MEDRMDSEEAITKLRRDHPQWNQVIDLAEIAAQYPDGVVRMTAFNKLKEINPKIEITEIEGRKYVHGNYYASKIADLYVRLQERPRSQLDKSIRSLID